MAAPQTSEIEVDARGHRCPVPTLRLRRSMQDQPAGTFFRLLADDPLARIDVPHFAGQVGLELLDTAVSGETISFLLRMP